MKLIALIAILFFTTLAHAQVIVNGQDINKRSDLHYIQINLGPSQKVFVDMGGDKSTPLEDEKGAHLTFNSEIAMLNFFYSKGWELQQALDLRNSYTYIYILKRKAELTTAGK